MRKIKNRRKLLSLMALPVAALAVATLAGTGSQPGMDSCQAQTDCTQGSNLITYGSHGNGVHTSSSRIGAPQNPYWVIYSWDGKEVSTTANPRGWSMTAFKSGDSAISHIQTPATAPAEASGEPEDCYTARYVTAQAGTYRPPGAPYDVPAADQLGFKFYCKYTGP
jgi:hypothetical protein